MCVSVTLRDQEATWGLKKMKPAQKMSSQRAQISSKVAQKAVLTFKEIGLCFLFLILFS